MNYIRRHEYRPNYENGTVCQNNIVFPLDEQEYPKYFAVIK